jgi:hypothetical protein
MIDLPPFTLSAMSALHTFGGARFVLNLPEEGDRLPTRRGADEDVERDDLDTVDEDVKRVCSSVYARQLRI